jgi:hypothetical protein
MHAQFDPADEVRQCHAFGVDRGQTSGVSEAITLPQR